MPVMEKLRMFVAQEPVVAASCLIAGIGLFLPAVVRPILDSLETSKPVPPPQLSDVVCMLGGTVVFGDLAHSGIMTTLVVAGITGRKQN